MSASLTRPPRDGLVRALPGLALRAADPASASSDTGLGVLTGYFLRFNQWTEINSYYEGKFLESIAPGAVKKTLQEGKDTIRCLFQHGMDFQVGDKPLGPQRSEEDGEGALYEVPLIDTSYNRDLAPGIDAGLYGASFCFTVMREDFTEEPEPSDYNPKGLPERVLREIRVIEFGPVTFPAYEAASAELESASNAMRSMTDEYLADVLKRDPNTVEQILERAARPAEFAELLRSRGVRNVPKFSAPESRAIDEGEWNGDADRFTDKQWEDSCVLDRKSCGDEWAERPAKERCSLPIEEPNGDLNRKGVHAAAGRIGAVTDACDGAIEKAKAALRNAYEELQEDAPDSIRGSWEDAAEERAAHSQEQRMEAVHVAAEADAEPPEAGAEPPETEAPEAEETVTAGDEPAADGDEDRSTAPPEGADAQRHPHAGRREQPTTEATRAAADTKETPMTLEELRARQEAIRSRLVEIHEEHGDAELPEAVQTEYDTLTGERSTNEKRIDGIEARKAEVGRLAENPAQVEDPAPAAAQRAAQAHPAPYDLQEIMSRARGAASPEAARAYMRDAGLRAIDQEQTFYHDLTDESRAKTHMEKLLRREAELVGGFRSEIAERIIATGSDQYKRAFAKAIGNMPMSSEEQRALATFTGSEGGYAVPYTLDPTLIPTSNSSVNPYRAISRVETILGNEWKGVTSGAVTVAYEAETTEATDNTPTLAQPTANPERCQAWIPYSMEIEQDWPAALAEMATLIAEGKDDTEAAKFTLGAGHGSNEPEGLLTGATKIVKTATTATFVLEDLYTVEEGLKPRFRPRAQWVANRFYYNKVRQFDVYGGAALWVRLPEGLGNQVPTPGKIQPSLAGYPAWECSSIETGITSTHKIAVIGDFRYFLIVDRIGMNIETVPQVFGASQRPTGQRGLFAFWRNTSKVLSAEAFRVLEVK